jgi:hypothetical protein
MIVNGWTVYFHPLFLDQWARLMAAVERDTHNTRPTTPTSPTRNC